MNNSNSFREYLRVCSNLTNLMMFVYLFSAASFNFYVINFFLKYIPGNVYVNVIVASVANSISCYVAGSLVVKMGSQNGMCLTFGLCFSASILLLTAESADFVSLIPFLVLIAMFGVSSAFTMLYMCTLQYFPNQFMGTVFGICNVTARSVTIFAPMVAEVPTPMPELMIILSCLGAIIATRFLKLPNLKSKQLDDEQKVNQKLEKFNEETKAKEQQQQQNNQQSQQQRTKGG